MSVSQTTGIGGPVWAEQKRSQNRPATGRIVSKWGMGHAVELKERYMSSRCRRVVDGKCSSCSTDGHCGIRRTGKNHKSSMVTKRCEFSVIRTLWIRRHHTTCLFSLLTQLLRQFGVEKQRLSRSALVLCTTEVSVVACGAWPQPQFAPVSIVLNEEGYSGRAH